MKHDTGIFGELLSTGDIVLMSTNILQTKNKFQIIIIFII